MYQLTPLTGTFGAEITGLDVSMPVEVDIAEKIAESLDEHKVLVVRDQLALEPSGLAAFASQFGSAEISPRPGMDDYPGVPAVKVIFSEGITLSRTGEAITDTWHTDGCVRDDTNDWLSFLHAHQIPPFGRDTLFADMEAIYSRLSPPLQGMLDGLFAVHKSSSGDSTRYPVALADPVSGRKSLYVNQFYTSHIEDLRADESRMLLEFLYQQTHSPECQVRVDWKPGTLVIWDNRRTQHYLVCDKAFPRIMHRVMVSPSLAMSRAR